MSWKLRIGSLSPGRREGSQLGLADLVPECADDIGGWLNYTTDEDLINTEYNTVAGLALAIQSQFNLGSSSGSAVVSIGAWPTYTPVYGDGTWVALDGIGITQTAIDYLNSLPYETAAGYVATLDAAYSSPCAMDTPLSYVSGSARVVYVAALNNLGRGASAFDGSAWHQYWNVLPSAGVYIFYDSSSTTVYPTDGGDEEVAPPMEVTVTEIGPPPENSLPINAGWPGVYLDEQQSWKFPLPQVPFAQLATRLAGDSLTEVVNKNAIALQWIVSTLADKGTTDNLQLLLDLNEKELTNLSGSTDPDSILLL